jgi:hypothetical protein
MSGYLHALVDLPPGKEPLAPIEFEAGWSPEVFWTTWRKEKFSNTGIVNPTALLFRL